MATNWPTSVDSQVVRVDLVDLAIAADFNNQDDQIRAMQQWLGTTGSLLGADAAGHGAGGIVSSVADAGNAFDVAVRANFSTGTLFRVGDNYDAAFDAKFVIEADGTLTIGDTDSTVYAALVTADGDIPNKEYVDDAISTAVGVENLWDRSGTVLSPATAGDTIEVGAGSAGAPGLAVGSATTGWYQSGGDLVGSVGGSQRGRFTSAGEFRGLGTVDSVFIRLGADGSAAAPTYASYEGQDSGFWHNNGATDLTDFIGVSLNGTEVARFTGAGIRSQSFNIILALLDRQEDTDYTVWDGGSGYTTSDVITLSNGAEVTALTVDGSGIVTTFRVDANSITSTAVAGQPLTGTGGTGTGFSLTPESGNLVDIALMPEGSNDGSSSTIQPGITVAGYTQNGFYVEVPSGVPAITQGGYDILKAATNGIICSANVKSSIAVESFFMRQALGDVSAPTYTYTGHTTDGHYHDGTNVCTGIGGAKILEVSSQGIGVFDGTESLPSVSCLTDNTSGFYFPDAAEVALTLGGNQTLWMTAGGVTFYRTGGQLTNVLSRLDDHGSNRTVGQFNFTGRADGGGTVTYAQMFGRCETASTGASDGEGSIKFNVLDGDVLNQVFSLESDLFQLTLSEYSSLTVTPNNLVKVGTTTPPGIQLYYNVQPGDGVDIGDYEFASQNNTDTTKHTYASLRGHVVNDDTEGTLGEGRIDAYVMEPGSPPALAKVAEFSVDGVGLDKIYFLDDTDVGIAYSTAGGPNMSFIVGGGQTCRISGSYLRGNTTNAFSLFEGAGSVSAPNYGYVGSETTGMYLDGSDNAFAVGGLKVSEFSAQGLGLADTGTGSPNLYPVGTTTTGIRLPSGGADVRFVFAGVDEVAVSTAQLVSLNVGAFKLGVDPGSVGSPTYSYRGTTDSGMYLDGSDNAFAVGGSKVSEFSAQGAGVVSAPAVPINAQTAANYTGTGDDGSFTSGGSYNEDDEITLSDGTVVTVVTITSGNGDAITAFTVDSSGATPGSYPGLTLTQSSVSPAGGSGFTLTLGWNNLADIPNVYSFDDDDTGLAWDIADHISLYAGKVRAGEVSSAGLGFYAGEEANPGLYDYSDTDTGFSSDGDGTWIFSSGSAKAVGLSDTGVDIYRESFTALLNIYRTDNHGTLADLGYIQFYGRDGTDTSDVVYADLRARAEGSVTTGSYDGSLKAYIKSDGVTEKRFAIEGPGVATTFGHSISGSGSAVTADTPSTDFARLTTSMNLNDRMVGGWVAIVGSAQDFNNGIFPITDVNTSSGYVDHKNPRAVTTSSESLTCYVFEPTRLELDNPDTALAAGYGVGVFDMYGLNGSDNRTLFSRMSVWQLQATDTDEIASVQFAAMQKGVLSNWLALNSENTDEIIFTTDDDPTIIIRRGDFSDKQAAAGADFATVEFEARNASDEFVQFAGFRVTAETLTASSEEGSLDAYITVAGAQQQALDISKTAIVGYPGFVDDGQTVSSSSNSVSVDCSDGLVVYHNPSENTTIQAPTNGIDCMILTFIINGSSYTVAFAGDYKLSATFTAPVATRAAVIRFIYSSALSAWLEISRSDDLVTIA